MNSARLGLIAGSLSFARADGPKVIEADQRTPAFKRPQRATNDIEARSGRSSRALGMSAVLIGAAEISRSGSSLRADVFEQGLRRVEQGGAVGHLAFKQSTMSLNSVLAKLRKVNASALASCIIMQALLSSG